MANQTKQLAGLLSKEGFTIESVQTNRPYHPRWVGEIVVLRALFRLIFYIAHLWKVAARVDLFHIMANSGWSWYLFAMPAVWVAKVRKVPRVVNYRGGEAAQFFEKSFRWIAPTLRASSCIVVPSRFLEEVFLKHGFQTRVVANIIDLQRFAPSGDASKTHASPHFLVARSLEKIYDNATAIRALGEIVREFPNATLTIAGTGPEENELVALAEELKLTDRVTLAGRVDTAQMPTLYRSTHIMLNPSQVDNMPNSILEALASGVPVVTTNVGGIPYFVENEKTALFVAPGDFQAMAEAACRLLSDDTLRTKLIESGLEVVKQCSWPNVRTQWLELYQQVTRPLE